MKRLMMIHKHLRGLVFLLLTSAALSAQNADYQGIWRAVKDGGDPFYFVLKDGVGYVITMEREVACSWQYTDRGIYVNEFPYGGGGQEYETLTHYFNDYEWRYSIAGREGNFKAVRISDPIGEKRLKHK